MILQDDKMLTLVLYLDIKFYYNCPLSSLLNFNAY